MADVIWSYLCITLGLYALSRNSKAESRGSKHKTGGEVESGMFLKGSYTYDLPARIFHFGNSVFFFM